MAAAGLDRVIDMVEGLEASDYTQESWSKLAGAPSHAKDVRADETATEM